MPNETLKYSLLFLTPLILSLISTPFIRRLAFKYQFVSSPRIDRWHKNPTALLGGIGIYLSCLLSVVFLLFNDSVNFKLWGWCLGGTLLFIVGLIDDKFRLTPYIKLFAQIIAACLAMFFGIMLGFPENNLLAIPLTLLWIVGITNAFNILDNIDGLAAGIVAISSLMVFFSSVIFSNNPLGILGLVIAGSALGFLPYNFNPAKIFMGDSGSMFLGYSIAVISITGTTRHISNLLITLFVPVLILSVPIFDTIFVVLIRKLQGKRIFEGGKDHTSHRLVTLGLSQKKTVLLLYTISTIFGLIAILYTRLNIFVISAIAFLGIVIMIFFGLFLFEGTSYSSKLKVRPLLPKANNKVVLNAVFLHKRRIIEVLLDFIFICLAYYAAYFLRFEGELLGSNIELIKGSIIWIILIKISVFFIFGLYRGMWRYISISDFFTIFKVVSLGSAFSILFLTFLFRFKDYSRAVFFIDWLVLLFLILGSRFLFRMVGEFLIRLKKTGKKVLIFGAGDAGEMVVREIKRNSALDYNIMGFLDDDLAKVGNKIQGIPVLGARYDIQNLAHTKGIEEIIIAMPSIDDDNLSEIIRICKDNNIAHKIVKGIF